MQDIIQLSGNVYKFGDIVMEEVKLLQTEKVLNVFEVAGNQVIHPDNLISLLDEAIT